MSKQNRALLEILSKPLMSLPTATLFHAEEDTLIKYAKAIAAGSITNSVSFNDFCKAKIIALQPFLDEFRRALDAFKQEQENEDYEDGFEDFTAKRELENSKELTDLFYVFLRYKDAYTEQRIDREVVAYELSDGERQKLVDDYLRDHTPRRASLRDAVARAVGSEPSAVAEFRRNVEVEKLPQLIEEYKRIRANEIYDSIHRNADPLLDTQFFKSLGAISDKSLVVASLANLNLGAKYEDERPDAARLRPYDRVYGDNYRMIDAGYSLRGVNLSGSIIKNSYFSMIDFSEAILRDTSLERVRMNDCILDGIDLRGADASRLDINYAFRSDFILPEGMSREAYIRSKFSKVLTSSHNFYFANRRFLLRDLESGLISLSDITPANQRMSGSSTREFEIADGASHYSPEIDSALSDGAFIFDPTYKRLSDDAPKTKFKASLQDLENFVALIESGEYAKNHSFNQYINNIYARPGETLYASLEGLDLRSFGSRLAGLNFSYVDFHNATLSGMPLSKTSFEGANLENANFSNSTSEEADFSYSNATCANFNKVDFGKMAFFVGTILDLAYMRGAKINASDLSDCVGRHLTADGAIGNDIIARRANLEGISALNAIFTGGDFLGANLTRGTFTEARMDRAIMRDVIADQLVAVGAHFESALMERISARKADFTSAVMRKARMMESDISGSRIDMADFEEADLSGAMAQDIKSAIGANFTKAVLDDADLKFSNLSEALLVSVHAHRADLRNVVLKYVKAAKADFTAALMQSADASFAELTDGIFIQAELDYSRFTSAQLTRANMQLASARGTDFSKADMSGANATGVKIDADTNLRGTNLDGAIGADHLRDLQTRQQDTLISRIFRVTIKNILIGAPLALGLYLAPCLALGLTISLYDAALIASIGVICGIVAKPLFELYKLSANMLTFMSGLTFGRFKEYCIDKSSELMNKISGSVVNNILVSPSRVDHEELAGRAHLDQIASGLSIIMTQRTTADQVIAEEGHKTKSFVEKYADSRGPRHSIPEILAHGRKRSDGHFAESELHNRASGELKPETLI